MSDQHSRRNFLGRLGMGACALPLSTMLGNGPLGAATCFATDDNGQPTKRKQRMIFIFTPNGTITDEFWPETQGPDFELKKILEPLSDFREQMLILKGVSNKVRGDGDSHMRGMSCLLTGTELMPGNIQGGSDTPAGWAGGISIDQELKNFLQSREESKTRFGSLEFGVAVPNRADPWTRMSYRGKDKPVAPIDNPYTMYSKMYGRNKNDDVLRSVLLDVEAEMNRFKEDIGDQARELVNEHVNCVQQKKQDLESAANQRLGVPAPELPAGVRVNNDNMQQITKMQMDLLVNGFANDMSRVATFQFANSVGGTRMKWLGFNEGHHELSHDPDLKTESQEKLVKINRWYAEQVAYLIRELQATKEPGSDRSLLDDTIVIWGNELGKGNSHTLQNIPLVLIGNAPGFEMGRFMELDDVPLNRLWLTVAHAFGHELTTFGKPELCEGGTLKELAN